MPSKLVSALFQTSNGIIAITALVASITAALYLFVFGGSKKSHSSSRQHNRSGSSTKKSPLKKVAVQKKATSSLTPKQSAKKAEQVNSLKSANKTNSANGSPDKKPQNKKALAPNSLANNNIVISSKKASEKQNLANKNNKSQSSQGKSNKDDGEWITVNKKKPRASPTKAKALDEDFQPKTPMTRSKTQTRTSSALGRTPKRN